MIDGPVEPVLHEVKYVFSGKTPEDLPELSQRLAEHFDFNCQTFFMKSEVEHKGAVVDNHDGTYTVGKKKTAGVDECWIVLSCFHFTENSL